MFHHILAQLLKRVWDQVDTVFALLLGAICSILGIIGVVQPSILASATLATLTVLAFALMRDRLEREKLQNRLSQLTTRFDDPSPDFFFNQQAEETSMLLGAEKEIWIVQETGAYIIETTKALIVSLLQKGGTVRVVVTSPKEEVTEQLAFRNHDFTYDAIINRSKLFHHHIDSIIREIGADAERLQVRFIPYVVDTLIVLVDPSSPIGNKRKAIIRYPGFRLPFVERLSVTIRGDTSPKLFSHYYGEAELIFEHASKIVLIIGTLQSDKSSMVMKLVESTSVEDSAFLFFVTSHEIWKKGKHIGFEVLTSNNSMPRSFAIRRSDSSYEVDAEVLASVTSQLEKAYEERKIVILDEIGSLQLVNPNFLALIEKILNDPTSLMFVTAKLDDRNTTLLQKIKLHYRTTVIRVRPNERSEVERLLEQEMKTALRVAKFIHHEF